MKVVILAGGFGTRLSEFTERIPKPMLTIGEKPILWHIMRIYAHFGYKEFFLALGYKSEVIKDYFLNYRTLNSNFTVNLATGVVIPRQLDEIDWNVTLVDTGYNTMTGGRLKRLQSFIGNSTFLLTYGDGVADINLDELIRFHKSHGKLVTITAVRPGARFGELELEDNLVTSFMEKPQLKQGWINGGYFVIEPGFFDLISGDSNMLEREPLERAAQTGELMAYKHYGFWKCMDTLRDKTILEDLWDKKQSPWRVW